MKEKIEDLLERGMFASRWLMAPVYVALSLSLFFITIKVVQEFIHYIPLILTMDITQFLVFLLHIVDLALIGNLVLMIIFAGYENFVSKIGVAEGSEENQSLMVFEAQNYLLNL